MNSFIEFFAKRAFFASMMTFMIILLGSATLSGIKLQELPDTTIPVTSIIATDRGKAASDIEYGITNRIEEELKSVAGLDEYLSTSEEGLSSIKVFIQDGEDIDKVNQDIKDAVDRVNDLPDDVTPIVTPFTSGSFAVLSFGVVSDSATTSELQEYGRILEKRLRSVSGVSDVTVTGLREREFVVELNQNKIESLGLDINSIINSLKKRNIDTSGGLVDSGAIEKRIITSSKIENVQHVRDTIVGTTVNGGTILLSDIAVVKDYFEDKTESALVNGKIGLSFEIEKTVNADIRQTVKNVLHLLDDDSKQFNQAFEYPIAQNSAIDMELKFGVVATNGIIGLGLVIMILSLALRKEIALWVSVSIPVCVMGVITCLPMFDMALDTITLAALLLVIGIVVDDSVVVAESIAQFRAKGYNAIESSVKGFTAVINPLIASLTTTCLVFVPMLFLTGGLGLIVAVIPITVMLALFFSLIECTFMVPAHLTAMSPKEEKDNFEKIRNKYISILKVLISNKIIVILLSIAAIFGVFTLSKTLNVDFFPTKESKEISFEVQAPSGMHLDDIESINLAVSEMIQEEVGEDLVSILVNVSQPISQGTVLLKDISEREILADEYVNKFRSFSERFPKATIKYNVKAGGAPAGEPVDVRVISNNDDLRKERVTEVVNYLKDQGLYGEIKTTDDVEDVQLKITPRYEWIEKYDYSVEELSRVLRVAFDGEVATESWIGDDEVEIRVRLSDDYDTEASLPNTRVLTNEGLWLPLSQFVKIEEVHVPREINHVNSDRYTSVTASITGDITPVEVMRNLNDKFHNDLRVMYEIEGEGAETSSTMAELVVAFGISIIGMYFVLSLLLNSLKQPVLILLILPYAAASALAAILIHNADLSFFGMVGILGMFGVVVNNSLVMINRANELKIEGLNTYDAIIEAAGTRIRPIVLTTVTTVIGLLPLVYGIGGSDILMSSMSLTLGYGLLFTLPVVLFVMPCYYALIVKDK